MRLPSLLSLLLLCFAAYSQEPSKSELAPCGTPSGISPWLRAYAAHPQSYATLRSPDTLKVGLQVHLLARNDGSGRFTMERLLNAFCRLNTDFAGTGIRFYFKNAWNLIDSTGWYQHATIPQGIDMMLANNVPDVLNAYFAADVAGNCGYNLPYAGVAISHGCAGPDDHTWAHEVGHALSLPHPFIGWEGKTYNPANPTPDTLTYNYTYFHDTIDTQVPVPLDTALVEYLDGSNCTVAADLICDTKPDYLSYRWNCDGQSNSLVQQKDPSGATFYSDGTLFMSYAADGCQNRFSQEQIAIMRATLLTEKANWLTSGTPAPDIAEPVSLVAPVGGQNAPATGAVLQWTSVPGATHYLVQASRFSSYALKEVEIITTDTTYTADQLSADKTYYWRVRPFNDWFACTAFTASGVFKTTAVVKIVEPDADGWRCYPSLLSAGQTLTAEIPADWLNRRTRCIVYDAAGRLVWQSTFLPAGLKINLLLPSENWPAGVFRLIVANEKGLKSQSLLLTR